MDYTINRLIADADFDAVDARTRAALADKGFGILTEIDVKATMKKKLDVEMPAYRILGACNPKMAHQAIGMEPRVGAMLPCNVILREVDGGVEVSAIDPVASMQAIDNPALHAVAGQVRDLLAEGRRGDLTGQEKSKYSIDLPATERTILSASGANRPSMVDLDPQTQCKPKEHNMQYFHLSEVRCCVRKHGPAMLWRLINVNRQPGNALFLFSEADILA